MNIILNADDLGMNPEVNQAIFSLMSERRITSATIMANGSAVEEAVKQQAEFPHCSFGIHLNGSQFYPLTQSAGLSPLLDSSGCFIPNRLRQTYITPSLSQALFEEWSAQIDLVQCLGVRISHFDSHHHMHTVRGILPIIAQLKNRFGIKKIRITKNIFSTNEPVSIKKQAKKWLWNTALRKWYGATTTDGFTSFDSFMNSTKAELAKMNCIELMVHPGSIQYENETLLLGTDWIQNLPFAVNLINYNQL